jgi:hypothetical protein
MPGWYVSSQVRHHYYLHFQSTRWTLVQGQFAPPSADRPAANMAPLLLMDTEKGLRKGWCQVMPRLNSGPPRGKKFSLEPESLEFRFLVAVDVEGFSGRSGLEQARVQYDLARAMTRAAVGVGLDRDSWDQQPRGDGELAVLPGSANGLALVADYPRRLASAVAKVNQARRAEPRLRVRLAIHHGAMSAGQFFGPFWRAPIVVSRLVDADILRQHLRQRDDLDVALIVSATVYEEIVLSRMHNLDPGAFRRTVIKVKGSRYTGYLYQGSFGASYPKVAVPHQQPMTV